MPILTGSIDVNRVYDIFTTEFLPTISKGIAITKDYFMDLFGRVIVYQIAMQCIAPIVLLILSIIFLYNEKRWRKHCNALDDKPYNQGAQRISYVFARGIVLAFIIVASVSIGNIIGWIYIPEWKVYEMYLIYKQ